MASRFVYASVALLCLSEIPYYLRHPGLESFWFNVAVVGMIGMVYTFFAYKISRGSKMAGYMFTALSVTAMCFQIYAYQDTLTDFQEGDWSEKLHTIIPVVDIINVAGAIYFMFLKRDLDRFV